MQRVTVSMFVISLGLAAGCDSDKSGEAPGGDEAAKAAKLKEIRESAKEAAKAGGADPTKAMKRTWELEIEGQPKLDGFKVMTTDIGGVKKYSMLGSDSMFMIDIKDGKPDPYSFMANFTETQLSCVYRSVNKQDSKGMTVKISGSRGEISGEVTCTYVADKSKPKQTAKVKGWFEF